MKNTKKLITLLLVTVLILESFTVAALAAGSEENGLIVNTEVITQEAMDAALEELIGDQKTLTEEDAAEPEDPEEEPTEPEVTEPTIVESGTCGDNLTWTLDSEGLLTISGKGDMISSDTYPWSELPVKKVVIESGVTSIGHSAFAADHRRLIDLTEIVLPDTLLTISGYAFNRSHITEFVIPDSVKTIGGYAFCNSRVQSIQLPKGIATLEDSLFENCASLKKIVIPDSVSVIDFAAFRGCSNLVEITFPNKLQTIGDNAFASCRSLEVVVLPDSVTFIGSSAFYSCYQLVVIYLPKNLTTIRFGLFQHCSSLEAVFLPAKVTKIDEYAFYGCNALTDIYYLGTQKQLSKVKVYEGNDPLLNATCYLVTLVTKQPQSVKTAAGSKVKFSTAASRSGCKFQWYYLAPGSTEWKKCSGKSAKTATLSFTAKESHEGYQYSCVITDVYDGKVQTQPATLTIAPKPVITKQPESATAKAGKPISVSVEAEGEGLKYQWYYAKKGSKKFKKASIKKATYATTMESSRDGRKLYCVITDKYGQSVKTKTVTISKETTPLVLIKQPEAVTVRYGQKATVKVEAEGEGLKYQWYYAAKGASKFKKASITKATYSVAMDTSRDGRQLYCVVKDKYGKSVKTDVVTINLEPTEMTITQQPVSVAVKNGKKATVKVVAEGDGLTYQWYYAKKGSSKFKKASITKATYSVEMDKSRNGRQLYCVITDAYGNKLKTDVVTISRK